MIFTYLIKSKIDNSFYTGISIDPVNRLKYHNTGKLKTTKKKKPWILVYTQKHLNYSEARKHEKWLKKKNHDYKLKISDL